MKKKHYSDDNPYLEDAVPCPTCGKEPRELIEELAPMFICGVPISHQGYGSYLMCSCGMHTKTYNSRWEPYYE